MPFAMLVAARSNVRFSLHSAAAMKARHCELSNLAMRVGASLGLGAAATATYFAGVQSRGSTVSRKLSQSISRSMSMQPLREEFLAGRLTITDYGQTSTVAKRLPEPRRGANGIFTRSVSSNVVVSGGGGGGGGNDGGDATVVTAAADTFRNR